MNYYRPKINPKEQSRYSHIKMRPYRNQDLDEIATFLDFEFPIRDYLVTEAVAEKDNHVVGYGNVRLIPEETIILHPDLNRFEKTYILKRLLDISHADSMKIGLRKVYGFITNEDFGLLLEKHYGYDLSERKVISLELTNGW